MQKEFKYARLVKISSLVYCVVTILFFMLVNIAAGFTARAAETGEALTGIEYFLVQFISIMIYVELFGYFAILWFAFLFFLKKNQYAKQRRMWPQSEKFPVWPFLAGLVFFLIFMSLMKMMLG